MDNLGVAGYELTGRRIEGFDWAATVDCRGMPICNSCNHIWRNLPNKNPSALSPTYHQL